MSAKNYYDILGVTKSSSKDDIKKAFYKLAAKYHPDKKGGDEAKFKECNEAYQVLSDEKKKREYDTYGQTFNGAGANTGGSGFGGGNPFGQGFEGFDFDFSGFQGFGQGGFQGQEFDLGDIFGEMFGGNRGGTREKRGRDMSLEIDVTFEESVFGTDRSVLISKVSKCKTCNGSRAKPGSKIDTCSKCAGKGKFRELKRTIFGQIEQNRICEDCDGAGQTAKEKCTDCHGAGVKNQKEDIKISVPAGISSGEVLRMTGMGEAVRGGVSGDLYIKVIVANHKLWRREGADLVMTHDIKLSDALLGTKHVIETLDGNIEIHIPTGSHTGDIMRVKGKGVASVHRGGQRGDVLIKLNIQMPKSLSKNAKEMIEKLRLEGF